jgi:hypothetical protein
MWPDPVWKDWKKHLPPPRVAWSELVEETAKSGQPALYHPNFRSPQSREELEMRCVREGRMFRETQNAKRCFYLNVGQTIGASNGRETSYVHAEQSIQGEVHGRPISIDELRTKGVQL